MDPASSGLGDLDATGAPASQLTSARSGTCAVLMGARRSATPASSAARGVRVDVARGVTASDDQARSVAREAADRAQPPGGRRRSHRSSARASSQGVAGNVKAGSRCSRPAARRSATSPFLERFRRSAGRLELYPPVGARSSEYSTARSRQHRVMLASRASAPTGWRLTAERCCGIRGDSRAASSVAPGAQCPRISVMMPVWSPRQVRHAHGRTERSRGSRTRRPCGCCRRSAASSASKWRSRAVAAVAFRARARNHHPLAAA